MEFTVVVIRSSGPSGDVCICVNRKSKIATTAGNISNVFSLFPVVTLSINYLFVKMTLFLSNKSMSF